jgi:hypothetical protein
MAGFHNEWGHSEWHHGERGRIMKRAHQAAHRRIWMVLGVLLPVMLLSLVALRQTEPLDRPAVKIDVPGDAGAIQ